MSYDLNNKPDIIIADDHLIIRQGLKSLLESENIANVIGEASNGIEFIDLLLHHKPDVVLMDIDMPRMNGMEATKKALELMPELKIIAFRMFNEEEYYSKMIDRGVKGFILKTCGINELEYAIKHVIMGESYFSNELLRKIINNYGRSSNQGLNKNEKLTLREIDIIKQICIGLTNEEIAEKLFISPKTVKSHKSHLLKKTKCKNIAALILFAVKNKIVDL